MARPTAECRLDVSSNGFVCNAGDVDIAAPRGQDTIRGQPAVAAQAAAHRREHRAAALPVLAQHHCAPILAEHEWPVLWLPAARTASDSGMTGPRV